MSSFPSPEKIVSPVSFKYKDFFVETPLGDNYTQITPIGQENLQYTTRVLVRPLDETEYLTVVGFLTSVGSGESFQIQLTAQELLTVYCDKWERLLNPLGIAMSLTQDTKG